MTRASPPEATRPGVAPYAAAIDEAYRHFVATLPPELVPLGETLPHRLGLCRQRGVPWSAVFNNPAVLGFPLFLFEAPARRPAAEILRASLMSHLFSVIAAFGKDRISDGQVRVGAQVMEVIERVQRARDRAFAKMSRGLGSALNFDAAGLQTVAAQRWEQRVFTGTTRSDWSEYRVISLLKQSLAFPACIVAAMAAGWGGAELGQVSEIVAGASLGLQYRDDAVDWVDDHAMGQSWAVVQMEGPVHEDGDVVAEQLHAEGALVRLLQMSAAEFGRVVEPARALGAEALAAWSALQTSVTRRLAVDEARESGFAVRWEKDRVRRREAGQQQAAGPRGVSF